MELLLWGGIAFVIVIVAAVVFLGWVGSKVYGVDTAPIPVVKPLLGVAEPPREWKPYIVPLTEEEEQELARELERERREDMEKNA